MDYRKELQTYAARRRKIVHLVRSGTPRSVVAKVMGISRQRVYQLTADIRFKNGSQ